MQIGRDVVAGIHYRILDEQGALIDETPANKPWYYLHGAKECPPGLERVLTERTIGERVQVKLPPEHTYGRRNEQAVFVFDRAKLPANQEPRVGMLLSIHSSKGETEMRVVEVTEESVKVDANHPLAGQTLTFEVEVTAVRRASAIEILEGAARQSASPPSSH